MGFIRNIFRAVVRTAGSVVPPKQGDGAYVLDCTVNDATGKPVRLADRYPGHVLMIVNVASKCGFTPQYEALEQLHQRFRGQKFEVLAFPCNDFGGQEPGSIEQVVEFCQLKYNAQFDVFDKITVAGDSAPELYKSLTSDSNGKLAGAIKWNFTKFIVGRDGRVKARIEPPTPPDATAVRAILERELAK